MFTYLSDPFFLVCRAYFWCIGFGFVPFVPPPWWFSRFGFSGVGKRPACASDLLGRATGGFVFKNQRVRFLLQKKVKKKCVFCQKKSVFFVLKKSAIFAPKKRRFFVKKKCVFCPKKKRVFCLKKKRKVFPRKSLLSCFTKFTYLYLIGQIVVLKSRGGSGRGFLCVVLGLVVCFLGHFSYREAARSSLQTGGNFGPRALLEFVGCRP